MLPIMDLKILLGILEEGTPWAVSMLLAYAWYLSVQNSKRKDNVIEKLLNQKDDDHDRRIREMREEMKNRHDFFSRADSLVSVLKEAIAHFKG